MKRLLYFGSVAAILALGFATAAGAERGLRPNEPAGSYMASVVKQKLASDYAGAWATLYPPHQRVASLDAYIGCESLVPAMGTLSAVSVLRTFNETIRVAGRRTPTLTRAVRLRVTVGTGTFGDFPVTVVQTFHAIAVHRHWRWILSAAQYDYYKAGTCPYV